MTSRRTKKGPKIPCNTSRIRDHLLPSKERMRTQKLGFGMVRGKDFFMFRCPLISVLVGRAVFLVHVMISIFQVLNLCF